MVNMPRFFVVEVIGEKECFVVLGSGAGRPQVDMYVLFHACAIGFRVSPHTGSS